MKNLTIKEFEEYPQEIKYLCICSLLNKPVVSSIYEDAIKKYPEYFPDIIEHRKKWEAIPQEVHDAYQKELFELDKKIYKDVPYSGKGILFYSQHPEEYEEHNKEWKTANKKAQPLYKKLHKKYYAKYGIKYNKN